MTIPSPSGAYAGIRTSDRLRGDVDTFINNMRDRVPADQNALLVSVMERFLDEAIEGLVIGMCDAVKLQGVGRKTVNVTVATVRGTFHMLSGRVLRGMKNNDVRDLAEHMDDVRLLLPDERGNVVSWTVVPLGPHLLDEILRLQEAIQVDSPQQHMIDIQAMLFQFMEAVVEYFYVRTLATLRLGLIARKLVEMGYKTVHSGAHGLIKRVVPQLSDQQVRDAADFLVNLIVYVEKPAGTVVAGKGRRATA